MTFIVGDPPSITIGHHFFGGQLKKWKKIRHLTVSWMCGLLRFRSFQLGCDSQRVQLLTHATRPVARRYLSNLNFSDFSVFRNRKNPGTASLGFGFLRRFLSVLCLRKRKKRVKNDANTRNGRRPRWSKEETRRWYGIVGPASHSPAHFDAE